MFGTQGTFQFVAITFSMFIIQMTFNYMRSPGEIKRKEENMYPGHGSGLAVTLQALVFYSRFS